jgi:spermidine/putrescine transport system ATP-binding protein
MGADTMDVAVPAGPETAEPTPAISLEGVVKTFRSGHENVAAVRGIDLAIGKGEFFSLLGPSGCGKTTTMRMIAGFDDPTEGVIRLGGVDVTNVAPNHRDVNMVFQSYALFPHMNAADNIAFGLKRQKVSRAEITSRVADMLDLIELGDVAKRKPSQLSGGQQQRVALARALINQPSALLLDEPLAALDLKLRQAMQVELKRVQREVGITFVYVTHDQGEALTMSDRIAVMNNGTVEQLGAPAAIYERPATRFVAGFIGTSNLLSGTASGGGDAAHVQLGCGQSILTDVGLSEGTTVSVTVRPEKIRIGTDQPDVGMSRLKGTISEVVYLGSATHYTVAIGADTELVVFQQNASDGDYVAPRGSDVWLSWQPHHSYVLPETPDLSLREPSEA